MALTEFQRAVCRLIAGNRIASGVSYVAGAVPLNALIGAARVSRDIDLFHDTDEAVTGAWQADRATLEAAGLTVRTLREGPSFVEAEVRRGADIVLMQWARESAFRFFPLVENDEFGLALHPFDLATNKVLALIGRLEVRDWIDLIECARRLQPLGYLAWAACGKDPGFGPGAILEHAARTARYTQSEIDALSFAGPVPSAAELSRAWHTMLASARQIIDALPAEEMGRCVLTVSGELFRGDVDELERALGGGQVSFHSGRIRGAFPQLVTRSS